MPQQALKDRYERLFAKRKYTILTLPLEQYKKKAQAELEFRILNSLQNIIKDAVADYIEKSDIGFNDFARKLDWSPTKVAKVQRGEANLTLASLAHLFALLGKEPQEIFKSKK